MAKWSTAKGKRAAQSARSSSSYSPSSSSSSSGSRTLGSSSTRSTSSASSGRSRSSLSKSPSTPRAAPSRLAMPGRITASPSERIARRLHNMKEMKKVRGVLGIRIAEHGDFSKAGCTRIIRNALAPIVAALPSVVGYKGDAEPHAVAGHELSPATQNKGLSERRQQIGAKRVRCNTCDITVINGPHHPLYYTNSDVKLLVDTLYSIKTFRSESKTQTMSPSASAGTYIRHHASSLDLVAAESRIEPMVLDTEVGAESRQSSVFSGFPEVSDDDSAHMAGPARDLHPTRHERGLVLPYDMPFPELPMAEDLDLKPAREPSIISVSSTTTQRVDEDHEMVTTVYVVVQHKINANPSFFRLVQKVDTSTSHTMAFLVLDEFGDQLSGTGFPIGAPLERFLPGVNGGNWVDHSMAKPIIIALHNEVIYLRVKGVDSSIPTHILDLKLKDVKQVLVLA
uniref:Uncharacterized protein n=1 Tax=Mycena chlorophos TaxID=658473 RepID=A0ABQ0KZJ2_MYCCL|nr:predicted protein [Mycena chlorophos]